MQVEVTVPDSFVKMVTEMLDDAGIPYTFKQLQEFFQEDANAVYFESFQDGRGLEDSLYHFFAK